MNKVKPYLIIFFILAAGTFLLYSGIGRGMRPYAPTTRITGEDILLKKAESLPSKPKTTKGEIKLAVTKLEKVADNRPLVSTGIPFAPGWLKTEKDIAIFDMQGREIPVAVKVLARWPQDQSIRSALVQFRYLIEDKYEYVWLKWGTKRSTGDLMISEPNWQYPQGFILMPAAWLCEAQVTGEQIPFGQDHFMAYDNKILKYAPGIINMDWTGDLVKDGYYSTPHVFYQLYVRSGELQYFLAARRELVHYRDTQIVQEGKERGRSIAGKKTRYIYIEALADDYLLTGDPRSLKVAGYMAEYLKHSLKPQDAFYPKNAQRFWTEREIAFPFLGVVTYYELTQDKKYLQIADDYMKGIYRTQLEWPSRGGFIHNLYAHDPEEGAGKDEYGGSPFMTGLLLEAIIKYHKITGSEIAADSIFRALDWLINEGLVATGDTFKYTTARKHMNAPGAPDLNLLIVHAFGYGYRLSGYQRQDYLETGEKILARGVKDAYLGTRKHFNQNYRSSGHYLAYVQEGLKKMADSKKARSQSSKSKSNIHAVIFENFEHSFGKFKALNDEDLNIDNNRVYLNGSSLNVKNNYSSSNFSVGLDFDDWNIGDYPILSFAYVIPQGTPVGMRVETQFGDWVCIGGTSTYMCGGTPVKASYDLVDDGQWHEVVLTYTGSQVKLFIDGLLQGETEWSGAIIWGDEFNIGYVKSNGFHFDGEISEIEILGSSMLP